MRAIDAWQNANLLTCLACAVTCGYAWGWQARYGRVRLSGAVQALARLNVVMARGVLALLVAVFLRSAYLIQTARDIDAAGSVKTPARVPVYEVNASWWLLALVCATCAGAWWLRRGMDRVLALDEQAPVRLVGGREERTG